MVDVAPAAAPLAPARASDPDLCSICGKPHAGSEAAALRRLAQTPARIRRLVKGIDPKGLATSYGPGKWTVREVLAHLRDCEIVYATRWKMMLAEAEPPLQAFDQDHWAIATRYPKQDARRALALLEELRASNLEMLKLAGPAGLARTGRHPEYGALTVGQMARHLVAHDENHLKHLEAARAIWRARRKARRVQKQRK